MPLPLGEAGVVPGVVGAVVVSPGEVPLPLVPLPLVPLVPLVPVPLVPLVPVPVAPVPLVAPEPIEPEPVVDPLVPVPLVPLVPLVPVPLVPLVPLVPDELLGMVLVSLLVPDGVVVVSVFLQAPSMAAMTAAVRMIFDALEIAFIV